TIVHPLLSGILNSDRALHSSERNLLRINALLHRGWEECMVTDKLLFIDKLRLDIDTARPGVETDACGEAPRIQRMRDAELGKNGAASYRTSIRRIVRTHLGRCGCRHSLLCSHGDVAGAVQAMVRFPEVALILQPADDIRRSIQNLPVLLLIEDADDGTVMSS